MHLCAIISQIYISSPALNFKIQGHISNCLPETSIGMSKEHRKLTFLKLNLSLTSQTYSIQPSPSSLSANSMSKLLRLKTWTLTLTFILFKIYIVSDVAQNFLALPSKYVHNIHSTHPGPTLCALGSLLICLPLSALTHPSGNQS